MLRKHLSLDDFKDEWHAARKTLIIVFVAVMVFASCSDKKENKEAVDI